MPLVDRPFTGTAVRAVFDNLLPDDERIRARIAARTGAGGTDAFSMLKALGKDCVGALQFLPEDRPPTPPDPPEGKPVELARRIRSLDVTPLGIQGKDDAFRLSLAGTQDKTALLFHDGQWLEPVGATPTTHILKTPTGKIQTASGMLNLTDSVQNERFCMALCHAFGLAVAQTEILEIDDGLSVLSVKRLDRRFDGTGRLLRLPREDMCQALGVVPTKKHEQVGGPGIADCITLLKSSNAPGDDRHAFMKAQIIFWLIGATDGHAKKFSLHLGPQGHFRMTPLYDILSTRWQHDHHQISRHSFRLAMAIGDKRRYKQVGFPAATLREIMAGIVKQLPGAVETVHKTTGPSVPDAMAEAITSAAQKRAEYIKAWPG